MTYPEPVPLGIIQKLSAQDTNITLNTQETQVDLSYITDVGWEIEARYDLTEPSFIRQPLTGRQSELSSQKLTLNKYKDIQRICVGEETLELNPDLSFSLIINNKTYFETHTNPFSYHRNATRIYENIMSLKVTDFTHRAPFAPKGETFDTHMVRFQYKRPNYQVFGIPGQTGEFNRNGYRFELFNTDTFKHTPDRPPLYQSWPILIHKGIEHGWVAVFHDNPSRTFIDIGDFYKDKVTFESITGNTRIYIITGNTVQEVSKKLSMLLGTNDLLPLWAFGYQQCRFSYMSTDEMRKVINTMRKEDIPLDAIYCDIDAMDEFRVFTLDKKHFNDVNSFTKEAEQQGVKTVSIVDPGVKIDEKYDVYTELKKHSGYLKTENGSPFIASVWPGDTLFPDFFDEKVRAWWADKQSNWLTETGFSGIWNDMNEPSNFKGMGKVNSQAYSSAGQLKHFYNLYGYMMTIASKKGWESFKPNERPFVITRSGYPGVQQHAVIWHGDNHAWWEHLRLALNTMVAYAVCGAYYTGADVPGFTGNAPDDLAIRFFQLGAWMPLYRGHSIYFCEDKEPYAYKPETMQHIRDAIRLRYSLLREWYTGFYQAKLKQTTPIMPILDENDQFIQDELLFFDKFLVAPIIERDQQQRLIYLPEGEWYRLGRPDKKSLQGNQWIVEPVTLSTIPVFVKAGNIIVRNTVGKNTIETLNNQEKYEVYGDSNSVKGSWYEDDGVSIHPGKLYTLTVKNSKVVKNL